MWKGLSVKHMTGCVPILFHGILYCGPTLPTLSILSRFHTVHSVPLSRCPPQTRPTYQHLPPVPGHALKKPSKSGPTKRQPAIRRKPRNSKRPSSHAAAPSRPPPPQLFHVSFNTHAGCNHKNAYGRHSAIRPPSLGCSPNAQKPPALSHPHAPEHATVNHTYPSPLGLPLLGATHRLSLPVTAPLGTSEIFWSIQ